MNIYIHTHLKESKITAEDIVLAGRGKSCCSKRARLHDEDRHIAFHCPAFHQLNLPPRSFSPPNRWSHLAYLLPSMVVKILLRDVYGLPLLTS